MLPAEGYYDRFQELEALEVGVLPFIWTRYVKVGQVKLTAKQKYIVVDKYYQEREDGFIFTIEGFCKNHGLKISTFGGWKKGYDTLVQTGVSTLYDSRGKPTILDEIAVESLKKQ